MSPLPEKTSTDLLATAHSPQPSPQFSQPERDQLIRIAHEAILAALAGRNLRIDSPSSHLSEPRGVFTTLYLAEQLRGCVGYVFPIMPLYQAVAETAEAAAFRDQRFTPVTEQEAPNLLVSLIVLSPLHPLSAEEVEIGVHGVVVSMAGRRGLLLPQVPLEHHWDRKAFLEQTCLKAGLPRDAWRKGALIEVFTAEVFGEQAIQEG
jgi:AmmeMemoRadiSam system protein A